MGAKRKRAQSSHSDAADISQRRRVGETDGLPEGQVYHPALRLYYKYVATLREHLLLQLPRASKKRRRRIAIIGQGATHEPTATTRRLTVHRTAAAHDLESHVDENENENILGRLLDQTLVCSVNHRPTLDDTSHAKELEAFSQQISLTAGSSNGGGSTSQSDLVDCAIWVLFHRLHRQSHRPLHMLCHGYQRARGPNRQGDELCALGGIPGVVSHYPNGNVSTLKSAEWHDVLQLLGKDGEHIMLNLIIHCGIFFKIESGQGNYYQLSGTPMTELQVIGLAQNETGAQTKSRPEPEDCKVPKNALGTAGYPRTPASIVFVRDRMFYARAALNAKGKVTFGLRHIHALNRYSDSKNAAHTLRLLQYIFPLQFGLHNVFTSSVDPKETVQRFKDYTLREQEIGQKERSARLLRPKGADSIHQQIPKRLKGIPEALVRKLQGLHSRCSYNESLKHYCPLRHSKPLNMHPASRKSRDIDAQEFVTPTSKLTHISDPSSTGHEPNAPESNPTFFDLDTPHANVSAFCRAVVSKLIPSRFWGEGGLGVENKEVIMRNIDRFVKLRRFEYLSLHVVSQGLKVNAMEWLVPHTLEPSAKIAQPDMRKRKEILLEFLYYIFDSVLIPLIRSNFHVTESSVHQNHLFYFRHDVWRLMTEPALTKIKFDLFEEIRTPEAKKMLDARPLGFSQIRLLPKATGVRPITNLRRRVTKLQNGKVALGRSINSVMTPVFNVLDFERRKQPALVGSALFSVGDMYPKLKNFARRLGRTHRPLYFAKADAKSCFDTIPQRELVKLIEKIISEEEYRIARHSEIKPTNSFYYRDAEGAASKPARKFKATARAASDFDSFDEAVETSLAVDSRHTVFVDGVVQQPRKAEEMLDLLEEHVERNVIKIGKRFFRQKSGIPQGSVLSSLLCNYFYAELEREHFTFLEHDESILLRLIDDFLLITTNKGHAQEFLQIMHDGIMEYGLEVNPVKSLANFSVVVNGHKVPQQAEGSAFPYCGNMIDTQTLEITKDRNRRKDTVMTNTLTVDLSKAPGKTFYRKALNALKIQTHQMFLDTTLNSPSTVLSTMYQNFAETAMKCYRYAKSMPTSKQPSADLVIGKDLQSSMFFGCCIGAISCAAYMKPLTDSLKSGTIHDLIDLAFVLAKRQHRCHKTDDYECAVGKRQVRWLAGRAFHRVLGQKQTRYGAVLAWLEGLIAEAGVGGGGDWDRLERIAQEGDRVFQGYQY